MKSMKMRRGTVILLSALLLTGCMGKESVPDEQDALPEEVPVRHLMTEEELEYNNRPEHSNGFCIGEVREGDVLFYEFTRPEEPDFSLRINEDQTEAVVRYEGKSMTLERMTSPNGSMMEWNVSAGYGGAVSGYGMPFWADMTGDGQPELLWLQGGGGTGVHTDWCAVYDVVHMRRVPIEESWQEMAEFVDVEVLEVRDGQAYCRITTRDGAERFGWQWVGEAQAAECRYSPIKSGYTTIEIDEETQVLRCGMAFGVEPPHIFGTYAGELETELSYDVEQDVFVCSGTISVELYEEATA